MTTGISATTVTLDEFAFEPSPRRISTFSRESKIFGETMHYANPIMYGFSELHEMATWCYDTFGPSGHCQDTRKTVWNYSNDPDYIFWFSEEKYLTMFVLRWS